MSDEEPEEVILEITRIGDVQRVAAVHVATGAEVVFQTPAAAALADVRALAMQLLERKLAEDDGPKGPGIVV
ncbi:MAG: hypothetical protein JSS00_12670 [Proteobacteria bacterium]|nr:hypothetical protein [Pseudomonadota bacterium]